MFGQYGPRTSDHSGLHPRLPLRMPPPARQKFYIEWSSHRQMSQLVLRDRAITPGTIKFHDARTLKKTLRLHDEPICREKWRKYLMVSHTRLQLDVLVRSLSHRLLLQELPQKVLSQMQVRFPREYDMLTKPRV